MSVRVRIVCLLVVVAVLLGIWRMDNRLNCAPDERSSLVQTIQRVNPSVVYVEVYSHTAGYSYDGGGDYKLWSGSGVIIDPGGLILTAAHVVDGADKFKITLPDGREFWSEESWHRSEISDVGFIQVDANNLPISYLGKSSDLRKGEDVFVIGCPFGYDLKFTVTKGIISGLNRSVDVYPGWDILFQYDAHGFPGNSGGPVYNMCGQIIGIHVGSYAPGLGVGVPVNVIDLLYKIYRAEQELEEMK